MSEVWNEDTGEPVRCPFCGSADGECPHLVASIDHTEGSCPGGVFFHRYELLERAITAVFAEQLRTAPDVDLDWKDPYLQEIWETARQGHLETGEPDMSASALTDLLVDLLWDAGAVGERGVLGGPIGWESTVERLYHEDPVAVCERAHALLLARLAARKPRAKRTRRRS